MKKLLLILLCLPFIGFGQETGCISGDCKNGVGTYLLAWKSTVGEWKDDIFIYPETTSRYEGQFVEGQKNGYGKEIDITTFGGVERRKSSLEGQWKNNVIVEGTSIDGRGYKYIGKFVDSRHHGLGKQFDSNGKITKEGLFSGGVFFGGCSKYYESNCNNGTGTFYYPNGSRYIGEWKNGKRHGKGRIVKYSGIIDKKWSFNGSEYNGEWKNDKEDGVGTLIGVDFDSKYIGEWKNGKRHGKGRYIFMGVFDYEGEWENGKMHGRITETQRFFLDDWVSPGVTNDSLIIELEKLKIDKISYYLYKNGKYIATLTGNCDNGNGTIIYKNGAKYEGEWEKRMWDGYGKYNDSTGVYEGLWKDNKKHGKGTLTYKSGNKEQQLYEEGRYIASMWGWGWGR